MLLSRLTLLLGLFKSIGGRACGSIRKYYGCCAASQEQTFHGERGGRKRKKDKEGIQEGSAAKNDH